MKYNKYVDFKYLLFMGISVAIAAVSGSVFSVYIHHPYISVGSFLSLVISIVYSFKFFHKAIPSETVEWFWGKIFRALAISINFIFGPIIRLSDKLGLFKNQYKRGHDEHSFIFMHPEMHGRRKTKKMPKWRDLTSNSQRIRFLFAKYLNYRIKKGYHFRRTLTPNQLAVELEKDLDEERLPPIQMLFENYIKARYDDEEHTNVTGGISDETVAMLRDKV